MPAGGLSRIAAKESFSQPRREPRRTRAIFQSKITFSRTAQAFEDRRLQALLFLGIFGDRAFSRQQRCSPLHKQWNKHLTLGVLPRVGAPLWKRYWICNYALLCQK